MTGNHGDDIYRYGDLVKMNFSSAAWLHADHSALKEHLMERFQVITNYPEPQPKQLEKLIAKKLGISPHAVMVTNGATEAIHLIARLFHHSASIIPQPTYSEYARACRLNKHIVSNETSDELQTMPKDRVYWICNPNTPSGNVLMKGLSLQNLLILHSIGKTYGALGLRLGYITGHPNVIQLLRNLQRPWSLSALAIEAGKFLIEHGKPAITDLDAHLAETHRFRSALRKIKDLRVFETKTNYMLCEISKGTSTELKNYLVHEHGMLIRDCQNFDGLSNRLFRVTTQLPDENDSLVAAIEQYISGINKE